MNNLLRDIRYGARMLVKKPGFTIVDAVLLRQLPVNDPAKLVVVHNQLPKINLPRTQVSGLQYLDYSRQTEAFEATAAMSGRNFNLTGVASPERLQAGRVTASFFPMLGVNPVAGRFFNTDEDRVGNEKVTVLSSALWRRIYGSSDQDLKNPLQLNGANYQVIGIAPAGLEEMYPNIDLWIPMAFTERELSEERRGSLAFIMFARLKQGTNISQAQSIMSGFARTTSKARPDEFNIEVRSLTDEYLTDVRRPLLVLFAAVLAVLLISCANVANLLLARASTRGHEIAVRAALGAGRGRIIRQLLTESILIAVFGGAFGMLLAIWGTKMLLALAPTNLPRLNAVHVDLRVLLVTLGVSLVWCDLWFGA